MERSCAAYRLTAAHLCVLFFLYPYPVSFVLVPRRGRKTARQERIQRRAGRNSNREIGKRGAHMSQAPSSFALIGIRYQRPNMSPRVPGHAL